ncbi:bestrophin family protein [Roseivirga sp. BDSF3-8]|uniref:bestrophin family protein n=1 Tax=Roseivirga sp. BDSF3-8 TaxID=3241598 RepID=UPI003531D1E8
MIVARNLRWRHILHYTWKPMLYFLLLSLGVFVLHKVYGLFWLTIPFNGLATLSTALAIYLGFKNNNAYDRWWEARKIWGLLVNYSRAWGREVLTLPMTEVESEKNDLNKWKRQMICRHIAFVHALRVFLRQKHAYNENGVEELIREPNDYNDTISFLSKEEFENTLERNNPPNHINRLQGESLQYAYRRGWLSDFRYVQMSTTLTEFNNHQGMSERIKNTPLPRPYSFFSRVFVYLHGTLVPFAFVEELGWINIVIALVINFVFLALDLVGERTEDPFENRIDDTPLTAISVTIEENLKEMMDEEELPQKPAAVKGAIF